MDKYYIVINNEQKGPFTIDELKEQSIEMSTLVWNERMENWEEAKNVSELRNIIRISPPPIPKISDVTYKVEAEIKSKKEKIIKPETEIVVAKEIKTAYRLALYSLIAIVLSYPIFFYIEDGFYYLKIQKNLPDCFIENRDLIKNLHSGNIANSLIDRMENNDFIAYVYKQFKFEETMHKINNSDASQNKSELTRQEFNSMIDSIVKVNPKYIDEYASETYRECRNHAESVQNWIYESYFDAFKKSLIASPIAAILLIIGRYVFKGVKWVDRTSKKAS